MQALLDWHAAFKSRPCAAGIRRAGAIRIAGLWGQLAVYWCFRYKTAHVALDLPRQPVPAAGQLSCYFLLYVVTRLPLRMQYKLVRRNSRLRFAHGFLFTRATSCRPSCAYRLFPAAVHPRPSYRPGDHAGDFRIQDQVRRCYSPANLRVMLRVLLGVVRRCAGAGKHFQLNPFGFRAPACAGRPRGGRGFRAGPGRVISPARRGSIMLTPT